NLIEAPRTQVGDGQDGVMLNAGPVEIDQAFHGRRRNGARHIISAGLYGQEEEVALGLAQRTVASGARAQSEVHEEGERRAGNLDVVVLNGIVEVAHIALDALQRK